MPVTIEPKKADPTARVPAVGALSRVTEFEAVELVATLSEPVEPPLILREVLAGAVQVCAIPSAMGALIVRLPVPPIVMPLAEPKVSVPNAP